MRHNGDKYVNTGISLKGPRGAVGPRGLPGKDGITPHIGENGNWYIGEQDTGSKAALNTDEYVTKEELDETIGEAIIEDIQFNVANIDSRLQQVEGLAELSVEGGQIGIASATDFTNRTAEGDLKIPTVGAILNGADDEPTAGSKNLVKSGGVESIFLKFCKLYPTIEIKDNFYENIYNGNEVASNMFFIAKGFVVKGTEKLFMSNTVSSVDSAMGITFYNEEGTSLLGGSHLSSETGIVDVPDGACYANISFKKGIFKNSSRFIFKSLNKYSADYLISRINAIEGYKDILNNLENGYIDASGKKLSNSSYKCTPFIDIRDYISLQYGLNLFNNTGIAIYSEQNESSVLAVRKGETATNQYTEGEINLSIYPTAKYFRATIFGNTANLYVKGKGQKLPDGSVTTDKLSDGSVTTNKLYLKHYPDSNYIDRTKLIAGYYIDANGIPHSSPSPNYYITDKIYLEEDTDYYFGYLFRGYYAFYDENNEVVLAQGGTSNLANPFTIPSGAVYGRFTINEAGANEKCWIYTENKKPIEYIGAIDESIIPKLANHESRIRVLEGAGKPTDYSGGDMSTFKRILCIGDSLTEGAFNFKAIEGKTFNRPAGYSYPANLSRISGSEVVNEGRSGLSSNQWYDLYTTGARKDTDLSGFDCCIINLCTNDVIDTLETVSKTAIMNIISLIKENNKQIKIFLSGMINGKSYPVSGVRYGTINSFLERLYNEEYADDQQVIFLDMANYSHLQDLNNVPGISYPTDNYNMGHLSAYGYWRIAKDYYNYISYIMAHDTNNIFRNIQFTGTDFNWY